MAGEDSSGGAERRNAHLHKSLRVLPCGSLRQAHTGGRKFAGRYFRLAKPTAGAHGRQGAGDENGRNGQAGAAGNEVRISDAVLRAGAGTQKAARMFLSRGLGRPARPFQPLAYMDVWAGQLDGMEHGASQPDAEPYFFPHFAGVQGVWLLYPDILDTLKGPAAGWSTMPTRRVRMPARGIVLEYNPKPMPERGAGSRAAGRSGVTDANIVTR